MVDKNQILRYDEKIPGNVKEVSRMKYKKTSSIIREYTDSYSKLCTESCTVPKELYSQFGVKRGLRDENGTGVLAGLTNISSIQAYEEIDGKKVPCDGRLLYRGYDIIDLTRNFVQNRRFGFEETAYLLLFGELPNETKLAEFKDVLSLCRTLPRNFTRDVIMKAANADIMNSLTKSVLNLSVL